MILSPVSGVVREISTTNKETKIGVYIRGPFDKVQDDHTIYSPIRGKINFKPFEGKFEEESFFSQTNKIGYIKFEIGKIRFNIYVGKGYVTDQIDVSIKDGNNVKQGQKLGEIVVHPLNSYAHIFLEWEKVNVKMGDVLIGGKTVLNNL